MSYSVKSDMSLLVAIGQSLVAINALTPKQRKYLGSWQVGT